MNYCQLNTLTCFEFGRSTIDLDQYAARSKELDYQAIAVADTNLYSFPYLADASARCGIKAIYGYRLTLRCRAPRDISAVFYIKDETGYKNLCKLISKRDSHPGPETIDALKEGLILVIDCSDDDFFDEMFLTALSPSLLLFSKIFRDDFFMGISITSNAGESGVEVLYEFCDKNDYKTIAFPQARYIKKTDAEKTELLRRSLEKKLADDLPTSGPNFLLSTKVLDSIYREQDLRATISLADRCSFTFFQDRGKMITFDDADEKLTRAALAGLQRRIPDPPSEYHSRLNYELDIIEKMNFSSYFLLVADYVRYARSKKIKIGPGRGSAAGSLVAFSLGITELDPIRFNLSFERFLNPKRSTMPDIDIDFEDDRRNEVVDYLIGRYGPDHVSPIITFTRLKPKSALNLIGPALSFNPVRLKRLTVSISDSAKNFKEAQNDRFYGERLRELLKDSYYLDICKKADALLNLPINTSQHAVGIIISDEPIYMSCPMSEGESGIVEYEFPTMERLGFLKFDILSLSNLTLIKLIEEKIAASGKVLPDIMNNLDDEETYDTLNRLYLADIFQLESPGMAKTIKLVRPSSFSDLAAILALYRPGPKEFIPTFARRKHGQEKITYDSELLRPVLEDTYGIMIYQEQVIQAVQVIADFSASDADLFRRAISKKKVDLMEKYKRQFMLNATKKVDERTAEKIYDMIERFAGYGFNKSHAYSYALITYELLYYKTHFPREFYAAAMETTSFNTQTMEKLESELEMQDYHVVLPDINISKESTYVFTEEKMIYLPFSTIASVGADLASKIVKERERHGPYHSFYDVICRIGVEKERSDMIAMRNMINSGCFDSFCPSRKGMNDHLSEYISFAKLGFEESKLPPLLADEDLGERLFSEKEAIGAILSKKLSDIPHRDGMVVLLVSDDSRYELEHLLKVTDGHRDYMMEVNQRIRITKNDFLEVRADFKRKRVFADEIINLGRKIIRYE